LSGWHSIQIVLVLLLVLVIESGKFENDDDEEELKIGASGRTPTCNRDVRSVALW
jgi:hypothetical protein